MTQRDMPDDAAKTPEAELAALRRHRESVDAAIADLGIVEIAARNPAVLDYMQHWEGRAEKAEAEVTALRAQNAALQAQVTAQSRDEIAEAALVLMNYLRNIEEHDAFEVSQDAVEVGEHGPNVLFAALRALAGKEG